MTKMKQIAERLELPAAHMVVLGLFIAVAAAFTFIPFIRFIRHGTQLDYRTWFDAAQAVLRHREIYPRSGVFPFMYPPTCALALALPALCGKAAMILLLTCLNTVAWILCIRFSLALAREHRFPVALALIPNLIVIVFIWSSYHLGQPSLLLLALMLGAFVALSRSGGRSSATPETNRQILAGALIAAAAAIKAFPFLAIIYLIYRRCWTATISLVIALGLLLFVVPIPLRGMSQTLADVQAWQRGMLRYQSGGIAQRAGRGYSWKNQSFFGLANRMLRPVSVNDEGEPVVYRNFASLNFKSINTVIVATAFLLGLWFVVSMLRARHPFDPLEFSALLILILLFTPLAFGYLFSWLLLPLAVLLQRVLHSGSTVALWCVLMATALLIATGISPRAAQIYGSVFFAALALYFGVTIELWRGAKVVAAGER
jgi:Glycosyltransferase family 87